MNETFGQKIKELRLARNYTLRELASRLNIDFTYLSKIENDRVENNPSIELIKKMAEILQADEIDLITLAGKVPPSLMEQASQDKNARLFFRSLAKEKISSEDWKKLLSDVEKMKRDKEV